MCYWVNRHTDIHRRVSAQILPTNLIANYATMQTCELMGEWVKGLIGGVNRRTDKHRRIDVVLQISLNEEAVLSE